MCAILDANVASEVFGKKDRPEAGKAFFRWIDKGKRRLVVGGKLLAELSNPARISLVPIQGHPLACAE